MNEFAAAGEAAMAATEARVTRAALSPGSAVGV